MSFRLFVYYCAMCGGCMAYGGWVLGKLLPFEQRIMVAGLQGFFLGVLVAFGLGVVDGILSLGLNHLPWIGLRAMVAGTAGAFGGLFGGVFGQFLYGLMSFAPFMLPGWILTGFLIGIGVGGFDLGARLLQRESPWGALRKLIHSVFGGTVGGLFGGVLFLLLDTGWNLWFRNRTIVFWSPSAWGFVLLGLCIGLLIGLAQIVLKEAWIRVEQGFRSGRELLLSKDLVKIGRAEDCDIGMFGDAAVEKLHARLLRRDGEYFIEDAGTSSGTFVNGRRIEAATPLRDGDAIGMGNCILRFGERQKRAE